MAEDRDDPLIGKTLSRRFEIVARIGAGGMGRIYRAIQRPLDRLVALKVLNPRFDGANDPNFEERFFLEALMTAKLRHPNTVTIYDYGRSDEGIYFMALELLEGNTLQQALVKEGPMEWSRALRIGAQVARSLREAHQLGLVHRDLKPANIMLLSEGALGDRVKVLDFGLVKNVMTAVTAAQEEANGALTQAGVILGSPLYMAPEQARKAIDVRSDIYSLGAVLFAAIAGRTPFLGKKPFDLMVKHLHEPPPELSAFAPVPATVNALVLKCLAKAPDDRFQDADALLLAMHQALEDHGSGGLLAGHPSSSAAQPPRLVRREPEPPTPGEPPAAGVVSPPALPQPRPAAHRPTRRRWPRALLWVVAVGITSSSLGAVLLASRAQRTEAPVPATSGEVVFDITSEPPGATVMREQDRIGVTPLRLKVPREGQEASRVTLALVLDGYETAVLVAEGEDGLVPVHQVLARRPERLPMKQSVARVRPMAAQASAVRPAALPVNPVRPAAAGVGVKPAPASAVKPAPPKRGSILAPGQYRGDPYE